ncbi:NAD(P)-dependent oxidoreductase [uncultured Mitsuokella sp.]|uniref:NAD-dependent epimerase/dehydratase family protein n=1 Tax=uncultured Mitsuokella sp. TaxID=453120 RepID=UPI002670961D|nr:NAD-dependent epimerase/dehydratase family protein [uncultured Mitsuokella sp.]
MKVYEHPLYIEDVKFVAATHLPWKKLTNKSVLISGATGLIGSFLIDVLMMRNTVYHQNITIYAMGRSLAKAKQRFNYFYSDLFHFKEHDINNPLANDFIRTDLNYVLHLASNTHPLAYATDPIGTITTNIIGLKNMLDFSTCHRVNRFAFASSNEIYGKNRGDVEFFDEDYCGYINSNTLRAGYPESKRCGEALCQAYKSQEKLDVVIPRFTRSYGPTLLSTDTKAMTQFLRNAINHEDIVLKSEGLQYFSYTYVADAVSALLTILLNGVTGEAYNIANIKSDIRLKDLATIIASKVGKKVIFQLPDKTEASGYSTANKARLSSTKITALGWKAQYDIETGIQRTITILQDLQG